LFVPEQEIVAGITHTLEKVILPNLADNYVKGQAVAISLLVRNLVNQLERRDQVLGRCVSTLQALFREMIELLEREESFARDDALMGLKEEIQQKVEVRWARWQEADLILGQLLEKTIFTLAEAEKGYRDSPREIISSMRKRIRHCLKEYFELKGLLSSDIKMDLLSRAQD